MQGRKFKHDFCMATLYCTVVKIIKRVNFCKIIIEQENNNKKQISKGKICLFKKEVSSVTLNRNLLHFILHFYYNRSDDNNSK